MRLIFLFVAVPLIELMILLKLAELITGLWTFALVVVTGVIGAGLARRQGWAVIQRIQAEMHQGRMPTTSLVDALMIFVAGALLVTPGVLTDLFGFSLLVPTMRAVYRRQLTRWLKSRVHVQTHVGPTGPTAFSQSQVIDSFVVDSSDAPDTDRSDGGHSKGSDES